MTSLTILTYHWNLVEYFKTLKNGQKLGNGVHARCKPLLRPHMCLCAKHKRICPTKTHAHSESTIFCTNPISGTIHGGLRGVVQAACDVFACKQAKPYRAMNITCIWAYLNIRCPSGVHLLRPSLCVWAVCDEKNIGLTCKPGQVPRAAQAGLCCHLQLEAFP